MSDSAPSGTRAGFVALIGAPNAGKSTLLNAARRPKGVDRHAQGADDARAGPRHRDPQKRADRLRRHARDFCAEAAAGARDGDDRVGRRGGRRRHRRPDRRQARADRRRPDHARKARRVSCRARAGARPEQGRHREARHAAGADQGGERALALLPHLHGLGAERRRRPRPPRSFRRRDARRARSSIRRTR